MLCSSLVDGGLSVVVCAGCLWQKSTGTLFYVMLCIDGHPLIEKRFGNSTWDDFMRILVPGFDGSSSNTSGRYGM